jgi:hypothetical protein
MRTDLGMGLNFGVLDRNGRSERGRPMGLWQRYCSSSGTLLL